MLGRTGTGKTHLASAIIAYVMRAGAPRYYSNAVDLVNRLEEETRLGKTGALAATPAGSTSSSWTSRATYRSPRSGGKLLIHLISNLTSELGDRHD